MTDTPDEGVGTFSDLTQAQRMRDILSKMVEDKIDSLTPNRRTGMILDIYQGGVTFNSDITVDSTIIPRTKDNPERTWVARVRCDDKWDGEIVEARIDPNLIPVFRQADFFDEDNPAGSGTMVDRAGRYITVGTVDGDLGPLPDTYPSLTGTTLLAPQAAPRVALEGNAGSWRVSELIRGVLGIESVPGTLMIGPEFASFDTSTLQWAGTIAFARGSIVRAYEITPSAPIITYGGDPLVVSSTEPVEIVLGQRSGSMYLNFSTTDGIPVLIWVESDSDTPIPPEWYLVFARINSGSLSSKIVFSSQTDFRSPDAPTGLAITYAKSGFEKIGANFTWDAVTEGTNGDPIQIRDYEIWGQLSDEEYRRITTTPETSVTGLTFDSGSHWRFKVRAIGSNGIPGVYSIIQTVEFPVETVSPGGGSKTYWQDTKPTSGNAGDEWFDTANGNAHYIYDAAEADYLFAPFGGAAIADAAIGNAQIADLDVEKLSGDRINGNFLVAGSFRTADVGGPVIDNAGIRVYDLTGDLRTAMNSDGTSIFRGQVEASGVEVLGKLKFHGSDSEVAAGARLNITGGVTAPTTSPNVYCEWLTITLSGVPKTYITGVTRDPANGDWIVSSMNNTGTPTATRHDATTGAKTATLGTFPTINAYSSYPMNGGIAFVDGVAWVPVFFNEAVGSSFYMGTTTQVVSTAGTRKTVLAQTVVSTSSTEALYAQRIAIGQAAATTQMAVSLYDISRTSNHGRLLLFTPSTSTISGNVACSDVPEAAPPIAHNSFDFGGNRFVLDRTEAVNTYLTSGAAESANNWGTGRSALSVGVGYYGGYFWTAGTDKKCYIYDGPKVGSAGAEFAATWYDSTSAGTGVHETPLGPSGWSSSGIDRARLRIHPPLLTTTPGDDGVDTVRIYARVGADMRLQGSSTTPTGTILLTGSSLVSGTIFGSVADFPATSPGSIQNATGDIILPGNGMAQLRGLNLPVSLTSETITDLPHGLYLPSDTALITTARGYPINGVLGMLEVIGYVTGSGMMHRYTTLEATPRVFTQVQNGSWSPWVSSGIQGAKGVITASHDLTTSGWNKISGYDELWDTEAMLNTSTGNAVVPAGLGGIWALSASLQFNTNSTGRRILQIERGTAAAGNSANEKLARNEIIAHATAYPTAYIYTELPLAAGDNLFLSAYQTSGAALVAKGDVTPTYLSARYLGPTP